MAVFSEMDLENKMPEAGTPETQKPARPSAEEQAPAALAQYEQSSTQALQLEPAAADDNGGITSSAGTAGPVKNRDITGDLLMVYTSWAEPAGFMGKPYPAS